VEFSFNRLSGRINKLRRAYSRNMLFLIWAMILTLIIMAFLSGCDKSSSSDTLPVTDLAADNIRKLNTNIGIGLMKWSPDSNILFYKSGEWIYTTRADGMGIKT
jgi:hypothetical protein